MVLHTRYDYAMAGHLCGSVYYLYKGVAECIRVDY